MGSFGEAALIHPIIIFKEGTESCVDFAAEILFDAKDLFVWFG